MECVALSAAVDSSMQWYDHSTAIFLAERLLSVAQENDNHSSSSTAHTSMHDAAHSTLGSAAWWHALHTLATAYYRSGQTSKAYATLRHSTLSVALLSPTTAASALQAHPEVLGWMDRIRYLFAVCW